MISRGSIDRAEEWLDRHDVFFFTVCWLLWGGAVGLAVIAAFP